MTVSLHTLSTFMDYFFLNLFVQSSSSNIYFSIRHHDRTRTTTIIELLSTQVINRTNFIYEQFVPHHLHMCRNRMLSSFFRLSSCSRFLLHTHVLPIFSKYSQILKTSMLFTRGRSGLQRGMYQRNLLASLLSLISRVYISHERKKKDALSLDAQSKPHVRHKRPKRRNQK